MVTVRAVYSNKTVEAVSTAEISQSLAVQEEENSVVSNVNVSIDCEMCQLVIFTHSHLCRHTTC